MKNIQAILTEAGMSFDDIVKTSIFLKDMDNFKICLLYTSDAADE